MRLKIQMVARSEPLLSALRALTCMDKYSARDSINLVGSLQNRRNFLVLTSERRRAWSASHTP